MRWWGFVSAAVLTDTPWLLNQMKLDEANLQETGGDYIAPFLPAWRLRASGGRVEFFVCNLSTEKTVGILVSFYRLLPSRE